MTKPAAQAATAAEFVRSFSHWRIQATREPVFITNHGREIHVMLDIRAYEKLVAKAASSPDDNDIAGLADWMDAALVICDPDMRVHYANRVAGAICRQPVANLVGRPIQEALPAIAGSLMEVHARRTFTGGEPSTADIPSPFAEGAWLRFQSFPIGKRNGLMFRDITDDVQGHRLADVKAAILAAMAEHGEIGYVRLSVRGTIERVDDPFCRMVELDEQRLLGISLSELVIREDRIAFRERLESVLRGGEAQRTNVAFLTKTGKAARAKVSMVQLHGAYGAEGAIVLLTAEQD